MSDSGYESSDTFHSAYSSDVLEERNAVGPTRPPAFVQDAQALTTASPNAEGIHFYGATGNAMTRELNDAALWLEDVWAHSNSASSPSHVARHRSNSSKSDVRHRSSSKSSESMHDTPPAAAPIAPPARHSPVTRRRASPSARAASPEALNARLLPPPSLRSLLRRYAAVTHQHVPNSLLSPAHALPPQPPCGPGPTASISNTRTSSDPLRVLRPPPVATATTVTGAGGTRVAAPAAAAVVVPAPLNRWDSARLRRRSRSSASLGASADASTVASSSASQAAAARPAQSRDAALAQRNGVALQRVTANASGGGEAAVPLSPPMPSGARHRSGSSSSSSSSSDSDSDKGSGTESKGLDEAALFHASSSGMVMDHKSTPSIDTLDGAMQGSARSLSVNIGATKTPGTTAGPAGEYLAGSPLKVTAHRKSTRQFTRVHVAQSLSSHKDAGETVWVMEFSRDGAYLATAGGAETTGVVRVWRVLTPSPRPQDSDTEGYSSDTDRETSPAGAEYGNWLFHSTPYREYRGHESHIVDLSWSRKQYLLSASLDHFVRLWHPHRPDCLHKYRHPDYITSVAFHPVHDALFASGCFDKRLRVWNIETGRVQVWQGGASMITSLAFSTEGRILAAGMYNGLVVLYSTEGLRYLTQIECRNRKGRFKNGRKVTGLQFKADNAHLLVTTNDSRARLVSMDDFSIAFKYKGAPNTKMQIRASFSPDGEYVICGSETRNVYLWRTVHDHYQPKLSPFLTGFRRYKNDSYECIQASSDERSAITCAVFAPESSVALSGMRSRAERDWEAKASLSAPSGKPPPRPVHMVCVTADSDGVIRVLENVGPSVKGKLKGVVQAAVQVSNEQVEGSIVEEGLWDSKLLWSQCLFPVH